MKLREYNRWFVPIAGLGSVISIPTIALGQAVSGVGGQLSPGVDVLALVWTVLAAGCVAVLTFGVSLPPRGGGSRPPCCRPRPSGSAGCSR